ncbi:MAG: hypothetical protein HGA45_17005 [Chloroflexales bacterium]|nr:hypothetical protein [Chloroflexales bacterium]
MSARASLIAIPHSLLRFAAALLLGLMFVAPARAQSGAITVLSSEAAPDFPAEISFSLTAEAAASNIVAVQLLYGATREEALTVVDLPVTAGRRVEARHTLDTQVYYIPPGTALTYRWVIRDDAGNELTSEPQDLIYHDERFPWSERTERNVTVFWYEGGDAFGQDLIDTTTRALDKLEAEIGSSLDLPVRIYIYASNQDMRSALRSNSTEWVGGQALPGLGVIVGAIGPDNRAEIGRLIPHELSHQVLYQATNNPYGGVPLWFDEGLAVHNQERRDEGWDEIVAAAAQEGRLIPLEALASNFPTDADQTRLSYAQSRDVVEFILKTYGEPKLRELVAAFAAATPLEEALPQVLGRTVDELDADWRATLPPQTEEPTVLAAPQTAPPERFEGDPTPSGAGSAAAPDAATGWLRWLTGLPAWATLAAVALCCVVGVGAAGTLLLVGLRIAGVDKRTD